MSAEGLMELTLLLKGRAPPREHRIGYPHWFDRLENDPPVDFTDPDDDPFDF